eukprot:6162103-Amphidinium_carterae.1
MSTAHARGPPRLCVLACPTKDNKALFQLLWGLCLQTPGAPPSMNACQALNVRIQALYPVCENEEMCLPKGLIKRASHAHHPPLCSPGRDSYSAHPVELSS